MSKKISAPNSSFQRGGRSIRSGSAIRRRDGVHAIKVLAHAKARAAATPLRRNTDRPGISSTTARQQQRRPNPMFLEETGISAYEETSTCISESATSRTGSRTTEFESSTDGDYSSFSESCISDQSTDLSTLSSFRDSLYGHGRHLTIHQQRKLVKKILRSQSLDYNAHYHVLELKPTCTRSEIRKAYKRLSLQVYPHKNSAPGAAEAFEAVNRAYATLMDKNKRHLYDLYGEDPKIADPIIDLFPEFLSVFVLDMLHYKEQCGCY